MGSAIAGGRVLAMVMGAFGFVRQETSRAPGRLQGLPAGRAGGSAPGVATKQGPSGESAPFRFTICDRRFTRRFETCRQLVNRQPQILNSTRTGYSRGGANISIPSNSS